MPPQPVIATVPRLRRHVHESGLSREALAEVADLCFLRPMHDVIPAVGRLPDPLLHRTVSMLTWLDVFNGRLNPHGRTTVVGDT